MKATGNMDVKLPEVRNIFTGYSEKQPVHKSSPSQLSSIFSIYKPPEHQEVDLVDIGSTEPPSAYSIKKSVLDNMGFLAQPIREMGNEVFQMSRRFPVHKHLPPVEQSVFPRSVVFELDYIKKQYEKKMLSALERERLAVAEKLKKKGNNLIEGDREVTLQQKDASMDKDKDKPFWYKGESNLPPSNIDDYNIRFLEPPIQDVKPEVGGGYTPGQIWKEGTNEESKPQSKCDQMWKPRDPNFYKEFVPEPMAVKKVFEENVTRDVTIEPPPTQTKEKENKTECNCKNSSDCKCAKDCSCQFRDDHLIQSFPMNSMGKRRKLAKFGPSLPPGFVFGKMDYKGNPATEWPESPPRLMKPWDDDLRLKEFMRVGLPYKKDACRWQECNIPFFDPTTEKEEIKARLAASKIEAV